MKVINQDGPYNIRCPGCNSELEIETMDIKPYRYYDSTEFGGYCMCPVCNHQINFSRGGFGERFKLNKNQ